MPLANSGNYLNLQGFGIPTNPAISGDTVWYFSNLSGAPVEFFGEDVGNVINFTDDGFAFFDPSTPGSTPWVNTAIPNAADPNNLMAIFWQDLEIVYDAGLNRGVTLATLTSGGVPAAHIIEYDDVQVWGDPSQTYDIEMNIYKAVSDAPGDYEVIFAYDNISGTLTTGTIGVENGTGTAGTQFAYDDAPLTTITDGMAICFDWALPNVAPVTITFQATVAAGTEGLPLTNTVTHTVDNPGSLPATASAIVTVVGTRLYLPIIMR
jgi:hypothetical protein